MFKYYSQLFGSGTAPPMCPPSPKSSPVNTPALIENAAKLSLRNRDSGERGVLFVKMEPIYALEENHFTSGWNSPVRSRQSKVIFFFA